MGKLPNKDLAHVAIEKLSEYCLNESHPYGKEKAIVFKSVLGITRDESRLLKTAILDGLHHHDCIKRNKDEYGERYTVVMKIRIFEREAEITTGWIITTHENFPRLTSCYIGKKSK